LFHILVFRFGFAGLPRDYQSARVPRGNEGGKPAEPSVRGPRSAGIRSDQGPKGG
jgi:hypothetical protein